MSLINERDTYMDKPPISDKKLVAIGGGTGLSTLLKGLKIYTHNITAVVTVADDGGGSGVLRNDLKILPPGDIRNCIHVLAKTDPIVTKLFNYRFGEECGSLSGQSFGNLFLAAMCGISNNFEEAVKRVGDVLKITGKVLPVTMNDVNLLGVLENGIEIFGESEIVSQSKKLNIPIKRISLVPDDCVATPEVIKEIENSDIITIGPGSLYTSIIPNLLLSEVIEAINRSKAKKIFICNLMTQNGETANMTAFGHIKTIYKHVGNIKFDYCLVNNFTIPDDILSRYIEEGASQIKVDRERFLEAGIKLIEDNFFYIQNKKVRHNYEVIAKKIFELE